MAAFVVSIEKVTATFDTTAGVVNTTVNLSKGQDETKCVPFCTILATSNGADRRANDAAGLEMIDNSGTPAVRVHRASTSTVPSLSVEIFVIEFGSNVTVQQGSVALTGTTANDTLTAITEANSFCIFSQLATAATGDGMDDMFVQARFGSTTSVDFDRRAAGGPDWTIYWYVVESDGSDFLTEYVNDDWTSAETGPTGLTLSNTIALANAFVVSTYETAETLDDMIDGIINVALTGTTTLTWYRNNGGTPASVGTLGAWVVRGSATEFDVQRFALDLAASTTNDQTVTAIDQAKAVILSSGNVGVGAWSVDSSINGDDIEDRHNSLVFTSNTNVRAQQRLAEASGGADSRLRFEVIEFELEGAPPAGANRLLLLNPPGLDGGFGGL